MITISLKELNAALNVVIPIVNRRSTLPVLQNIQITPVNATAITLFATDLEANAKVTVQCEVAEVQAFSLNYAAFIKFTSGLVAGLKKGTDAPLTLEVTAQDDLLTAKLSCNGITTELPAIGGDYFPSEILAHEATPESATLELVNNLIAFVDTEKFIGALSRVRHSASSDLTRPVLTAICFKVSATGYEVATADSFRLAIESVATETGVVLTTFYLLPARLVPIIKKMFNPDCPIRISRFILTEISRDESESIDRRNVISLAQNSTYLDFYEIAGTFPNYEFILWQEGEATTRLELDYPQFLKAVKFALNAPQATCVLPLPVIVTVGKTHTQDGTVNSINARYLLDLLNSYPQNTEKVAWCIKDTYAPVLFYPLPDINNKQLIMPMHSPEKRGR